MYYYYDLYYDRSGLSYFTRTLFPFTYWLWWEDFHFVARI